MKEYTSNPFMNDKEIQELYLTNPIINAGIKMFEYSNLSFEESCFLIIKTLVNENKELKNKSLNTFIKGGN